MCVVPYLDLHMPTLYMLYYCDLVYYKVCIIILLCVVPSVCLLSGLAIGNLAIGIACNLQIIRQEEIFNDCIRLPARQGTDIMYV